jgi:hypothetical protein
MHSATAAESPESTEYMNFTSLWPSHHAWTAAISAPISTPPATVAVTIPALWKTGAAASMRGWMLPVPGVAMTIPMRSPFFRVFTMISAAAAPAVALLWPM